LKHWLNGVAKTGMKYSEEKIAELRAVWEKSIDVSLVWFDPLECYRRQGSRAINRALFDLTAFSASKVDPEYAAEIKTEFRGRYTGLLGNEEFQDLISRSVDHTKRTKRRFEMWNEEFEGIL
jgi:putative NADPH-quinone reductase